MSKPMLGAELQIQDWVQGLAGIPAAEFTQDIVQRYKQFIGNGHLIGSSLR